MLHVGVPMVPDTRQDAHVDCVSVDVVDVTTFVVDCFGMDPHGKSWV